jgi:hypothetical protein
VTCQAAEDQTYMGPMPIVGHKDVFDVSASEAGLETQR